MNVYVIMCNPLGDFDNKHPREVVHGTREQADARILELNTKGKDGDFSAHPPLSAEEFWIHQPNDEYFIEGPFELKDLTLDQLIPKEIELLKKNQTIQAIKEVRQRMGCQLGHAHRLVRLYMAQHPCPECYSPLGSAHAEECSRRTDGSSEPPPSAA